MIQKGQTIKGANVLILGVTLKENCPDIRNTKVVDIYRELCEFGVNVDVYDPWAKIEEVNREFGVVLLSEFDTLKRYNAILLAVAH